MDILIGIGVFVVVLFVMEVAYFAFRNVWNPERKLVRRRLGSLSITGDVLDESIDISRKKRLSEVPWLNRLLSNYHWGEKMHRLLEQGGVEYPLGFFIEAILYR